MIALDFSETMLGQTKQFLEQEKLFDPDRITLVRADVARLPFKSASVDCIHAGIY